MLVCLILFIGVVRADKNTAQEPSQRMIAAEQSAPEAPKPTATPTPTPEPTPEPPTDLSSDTTNNTTGAYVGSTQSDKYHDPSCGWARKILQENEIWFNSIEDAKAAGYYPCGVCNP